MRRALLGAAAFVLTANLAALTTGTANEPKVDAVAELPAEDFTASTITLPPSTSTTTTATTLPATRPINPPTNAYADEPHIVLGEIAIPKLGLNVPLNEGISLRSIDRGPSHWPGSALPGGTSGNVVVAGHRVTHTRPFRYLDTLVPGDEIIFTVNGLRSVYRVTGHDIVTPKQTEIVNQTAEPTATLFACHPPHSARYRYVVHAALASTTPV